MKSKDAKDEAISQFPIPNNKKELMQFLGIAGYYRCLVRTSLLLLNHW